MDDEPFVCKSIRRTLSRDGYDIYAAHSADEALKILSGQRIDVIISDQDMPGMRGTEFLNKVSVLYPDTVRLILSGAAEIPDITGAMVAGTIYKFLTKPIAPSLLRANIVEAFSRARYMADLANAQPLTDSTSAAELTQGGALNKIFPSVADEANSVGAMVCLSLVKVCQFDDVAGGYGQSVSDAYMRIIGEKMTNEFGSFYHVAPYKPGYYLILTYNADPNKCLLGIGTRVRRLFASPIRLENDNFSVTVHFGMTFCPGNSKVLATLIDEVSTACMEAKNGKADSVQFFQPVVLDAKRRALRIESELRHALVNDSFELYYQPQVNIETGGIVGLEALLRWPHAELGFISPLETMPIAERLGLIDEIGLWVLRSALSQYAHWISIDVAPVEIAVNVSPTQLENKAFSASVQTALEQAKVAPGSLVLEITETAAINDSANVRRNLNQLSELGVKLAIDDFGAGYANLNYLSQFLFKKLKIDRALVPREHNDRSQVLFADIVGLAERLGLDVVAEGVESPLELAAVYRAGCRVVQGYFYSPAVRPDRIQTLLGTRFEDQTFGNAVTQQPLKHHVAPEQF